MNQHPGVTCPTCKSWKSPLKMYHDDETANTSYGRRHSTRCNECGAEFTYRPVQGEKRKFTFGRLRRKPRIREMVVVKEGKL